MIPDRISTLELHHFSAHHEDWPSLLDVSELDEK